MQLRTTGELRGFLADVLVGIRDGSIDANQANSISKVAAQINQSLATEVQARINLKELGGEAGAMVIASESELRPRAVPQVSGDTSPPTEPPKIITENIQADSIEPAKVQPVNPVRLEDATVNFARNQSSSGEKTWCDQCEQQVTTSQAVSCK